MANSRALAASILGAVLGGIAGYLLFTEEGRSFRRRLEPALEDIAKELTNFRSTVQKVADVMTEGRKLFTEAMADEHPRYPNIHQTTPF